MSNTKEQSAVHLEVIIKSKPVRVCAELMKLCADYDIEIRDLVKPHIDDAQGVVA